MALEIFVGRTALPTASTGTTDLTSADSSTTPVGSLYNPTKCQTTDTLSGDSVFQIGMSDGTTERAMSSTANDVQVASDVTNGMYDAAIGTTVPGNQSQDIVLNHNSFIAGGERVDNTDGGQQSVFCHSMFFAGCNYAVLGGVLNATVDTALNVDPGFAWDVVLVTQTRETTLGDEDADQRGSFGFMVKADDEQACLGVYEDNGDASPGNQLIRTSTVYSGMICNQDTGAIIVGIDVQEGSGTSCDIFPRLAGGELVQLGLTFIGFTDGESAKIVEWDSPTATGNNAVTGAGGTPEALIHLLTRLSAYDTVESDENAGVFGVSFITDDSQFSFMSGNETTTGGNSDCRNMSSPQSIKVTNDAFSESATDSFDSTHVSMDSDGWTENWTARISASGRKQLTLAFVKAGAIDVGLATETDTAFGVTVGDQTVTTDLATSVESAFSVDWSKDMPVGLATETDISQPVTTSGLGGPVGLAEETDTAINVTREGATAVGLITTADTGQAVLPRHDVDANKVIGIDTALPITVGLAFDPTQVTEVSTALSINAHKRPQVALVNEVDLALGLTFDGSTFVGLATDVSIALPIGTATVQPANLIIEIDIAHGVQAGKFYAAVGLPTTTDTAFDVTVDTVLVPVDLGWEDDENTWGGVGLGSLDFAPVILEGMEFRILGYDATTPLDTFLERKAVVYERGAVVLGTAVWPDIIGPDGSCVQIMLGSHDIPDGAITWEGPYDFVIGEDDMIDFATAGRYLAIRFESSGIPAWTLQSYDIDYEIVGQH